MPTNALSVLIPEEYLTMELAFALEFSSKNHIQVNVWIPVLQFLFSIMVTQYPDFVYPVVLQVTLPWMIIIGANWIALLPPPGQDCFCSEITPIGNVSRSALILILMLTHSLLIGIVMQLAPQELSPLTPKIADVLPRALLTPLINFMPT